LSRGPLGWWTANTIRRRRAFIYHRLSFIACQDSRAIWQRRPAVSRSGEANKSPLQQCRGLRIRQQAVSEMDRGELYQKRWALDCAGAFPTIKAGPRLCLG